MKSYLKSFTILSLWLATCFTLSAQDYHDPQNMPVEPENTDCHKLPDTFENADQAVKVIEATRFNLSQDFKTTRRQGLMAASYHSCNFKTGYLVVKFDGEHQIFPDVPLETWEKFQGTSDIDGFYYKNIKTLSQIKDE